MLYLCTVFKRLKIFHKFVWFRLVVSNVILRVDKNVDSFVFKDKWKYYFYKNKN